MKRLSLCFAMALLATLLCVLPVMASFHQGPEAITLPSQTIDEPAVTTLPATDVTHNSATLNASVMMPIAGNGGNLIYVDYTPTFSGHFQYGTASGVYTSITPEVTKQYASPITFRTTVTGLRPCTKYYARLVFTAYFHTTNHKKISNDYLISFLSPGTAGIYGLGVGMGFTPTIKGIDNLRPSITSYGNEIIFTTTGCQISTGPLGQGGSVGTGSPAVTTTGPIQMSNIVVQSASIAAPTAAPGQKVDVTASITNKGGANGDAKVTLYVNGQEMDSQSITLASGQTSPVHFSLSMNEPGTYTVNVGNVPAGSLTVDAFANNDFLIYSLIALFTIGIAVVIYMVTRKRTA